MAYPDTYYRQRQAKGEEIAGKSLQNEMEDNDAQAHRAVWVVYAVAGAMVSLVLTRILLRIAALEDTAIGGIVHGLTDPYVWVFNSLFSASPRLLLATVEPGSLVSIVFFPLVAWAIRGLIYEVYKGKHYFVSAVKLRR